MELNGPDDPSTLMTQSAMASAYRKLGRLTDAERHYTICFAARQRAVGLDNYVCVDLAISLSYVYRELCRKGETAALLELCLPLETLKRPENFERVCQIKHLQALLLYDDDPQAAELSLRDLIAVAGRQRPPENRETMWVRLTLATWLRKSGRMRDALLLFGDLVTSTSSSPDGEDSSSRSPVTEKQCTIAEGVRPVKAGLAHEAQQLLRKNGLKWIRDCAFHIIHGVR